MKLNLYFFVPGGVKKDVRQLALARCTTTAHYLGDFNARRGRAAPDEPALRRRMGDAATVLTTARWSEDTYYLKEFVHKFKFPQVAKVRNKKNKRKKTKISVLTQCCKPKVHK